jgi:hypothetical protein
MMQSVTRDTTSTTNNSATKECLSKRQYEWVRNAQLAFNTALSLLGVAVGVICLAWMLNEVRPEFTPREMLWGGLGVALVIVLTGILGIASAMGGVSDEQDGEQSERVPVRAAVYNSTIVCYILLAVLLAIVSGVAIRHTAHYTKSAAAVARMSRAWSALHTDTAVLIQDQGQCCGFASYKDRLIEPCIRRQQERGCQARLVEYYGRAGRRMLPVMWTVLMASVLAIVSGVLFWAAGYHLPEPSHQTPPTNSSNTMTTDEFAETPMTPKGQSYEAWHRTIFQ